MKADRTSKTKSPKTSKTNRTTPRGSATLTEGQITAIMRLFLETLFPHDSRRGLIVLLAMIEEAKGLDLTLTQERALGLLSLCLESIFPEDRSGGLTEGARVRIVRPVEDDGVTHGKAGELAEIVAIIPGAFPMVRFADGSASAAEPGFEIVAAA